jgi:hypothetical protein
MRLHHPFNAIHIPPQHFFCLFYLFYLFCLLLSLGRLEFTTARDSSGGISSVFVSTKRKISSVTEKGNSVPGIGGARFGMGVLSQRASSL